LVVALLRGRNFNVAPAATDTTPDAPPAAIVLSAAAETTAVAERAPATVASPSGAFCARCGEPVSVKVRDYCLAHPQRFGGLIYCFKHQRAVRPAG